MYPKNDYTVCKHKDITPCWKPSCAIREKSTKKYFAGVTLRPWKCSDCGDWLGDISAACSCGKYEGIPKAEALQ